MACWARGLYVKRFWAALRTGPDKKNVGLSEKLRARCLWKDFASLAQYCLNKTVLYSVPFIWFIMFLCKNHRGINSKGPTLVFLFGSHATSPILWIGKPTPAIQSSLWQLGAKQCHGDWRGGGKTTGNKIHGPLWKTLEVRSLYRVTTL